MLTKLLKYEFMASARKYGALYLALLAGSVVTGLYMGVYDERGLQSDNADFLAAILGIIYTVLAVALVVVTFYTIIQRFKRSLFGREGYLMHTLPVTSGQLTASKLIAATVWSVCGVFVACVSAGVLMLFYAFGCGVTPAELIAQLAGVKWGPFIIKLVNNFGVSIIWLVIDCLAGGVCLIASIYASCIVGRLSKKHPTLAGIGAFLGFSIIQIWVQDTTLGSKAYKLFISSMLPSNVEWSEALIYLAFSIVFSALYLALTVWFMDNRLDLE